MKVIAPIYENAESRDRMYLRGVVCELTAEEFAGLQGIRDHHAIHGARPFAGQMVPIKSAAMVRESLEKVRDETRTTMVRADDAARALQRLADDLKAITEAVNDKPPQKTETE